MNNENLFGRFLRSMFSRLAMVALILLAWSSVSCNGIPPSVQIQNAARNGDLATIQRLVKEDPGLVSSKNDEGSTPLHWAAIAGKKDVAEWLLADKAEVNAADNNGRTPLHAAALHGRQDLVELLVGKGANVNAKENHGHTPMYFAAKHDHNDVAAWLQQQGGKE